ncbi:hypothetical protein IC608_10380 [Devosia sp. PTR5]|uniref:Uncharacterized protein n=2 Tax=Devosia oryzisoli TaxID=2774138 RepID=A0A927ITH4_9HYPH|nr:hypothetical protein [Devosia oryzisoli]
MARDDLDDGQQVFYPVLHLPGEKISLFFGLSLLEFATIQLIEKVVYGPPD